MNPPEEQGNGPVVHDHRRIDPVTGQVREPDRHRGRHAASKPGGFAPAEASGPQGESPQGDQQHGQGAEPEGSAPGPGPAAANSGSGIGPAAEADRPLESGGTGEGKEMEMMKDQLVERTADLQRLQAEYANYRKRVDRDRTAMRELALANVLTEMLPALDAIGQARQHDELSGGFKSVAETIESAVSKLGLVTYGETGEPFDPKVHEAVATSYSPDVTEVTLTEIFQPGYKVGDRILRPARVVVAEPATGPDGSAEPGAQAQQDQDNQ
jgi:molecular chaperone GrpE